ncbi:MAG: ferrous iron transport protein B [Desulfobacteraceae bacterium]|nr:ferrous iron transport protein B [Desulfobacteraceae bacterium]
MKTTIALAGNPNAGKTTLFNALTGARQHVGNYPGVTVEKKQGVYQFNGNSVQIVDLPGTYSLSAYSLEEVVARDFLVKECPAVVVNILDASNLERNLYLTMQFMEMGLPVCIALNMMDLAEKRGIEINVSALSKALGTPVIATIARNGAGKKELMQAAIEVANNKTATKPFCISYGEDIDGLLRQMEKQIRQAGFLTDTYDSRWIALKYLESDEQIVSLGQKANAQLSSQLELKTRNLSEHLFKTLETYPEAIIADHRYGYIKSILKQDVIRFRGDQNRLFISDKIDKVLVNRFAGPLIMLAVLLVLYHFTFSYSAIPVAWMEAFFVWIGGLAQTHLADGVLKSLIIAGIIDGVGGVLGFVPLIMFMFLGVALLEDTGYLARVAFMMDRVFRVFGLHGSSVMAYIVSGGIAGGCAVPGVMASRTLKSRKERLATLLTVPFMNCGAKLPVFALLVAAFFSEKKAIMMFVLTLIAWIGALLVAKLLRITVIRGESTPFVMELPPYRCPTFKGLAIHTWERTWQYIKKAGTVILGISILLWSMMTFPGLPESQGRHYDQQRETLKSTFQIDQGIIDQDIKKQLALIDKKEAEAALRHSIAGRLGTALEPVSRLAGFDWRTNISLVGGFAAKEVIVSTLGTAYSLGQTDSEQNIALSKKLAQSPNWSPLTAISAILFIMFYAPCFVSVACICRESGSWKWGAFSIVFNTLLAFFIAGAVYQIGGILGF